jgi:hypothetical protein
MAPQTEWFVASESFTTQEGEMFTKDTTRVKRGDPILKLAPHLFKPLEASRRGGAPDVEAATAAPGEKRAPRTAPEKEEPKAAGLTTQSTKGK